MCELEKRRMTPRLQCSLLPLLSAFFTCQGFVLMTAGVMKGFEMQVFEPGGAWNYNLNSTVLFNEKDGTHAKDVGFFISGRVDVASLWKSSTFEKMIRIQLSDPKLNIRSRKAPMPEGFMQHKSLLESLDNKPFFLRWNKGKIEKIYVKKDETIALKNLKKGIASLLQFQVSDDEQKETDTSGHCNVKYESSSQTKLTKTKLSCTSPDLQLISVSKPLLATNVESEASTVYEFEETRIKSVISDEKHVMTIAAKEDMGNEVEVRQELKFVKESTVDPISAPSFEEALEKAAKREDYSEESLLSDLEHVSYEDSKDFAETIKANRDNLKTNVLGTAVSTKAFLQVVAVARKAKTEDITKALNDGANKKLLPQLFDVLGYTQTQSSHAAAMSKLRFDDPKVEELSERYLWALSVHSNPSTEIAEDLLNKYKKTENIPEKVKETMILSIASIAYHIRKQSEPKVCAEIEETILNYLEASKDEHRYPFIRALRNLRSQSTEGVLLNLARKGSFKEGVLAWKALKALDVKTPEILKAAVTTFFQIDRKHDSSSRTLALDVILESNPNEEILLDLLYYLISKDQAFEIKQYLIQRLRMTAEKSGEFQAKLYKLMANDLKINNYATMGQKGLSVALMRQFSEGPSSNGSLLTVQEMNGGIVKRGVIDVMLDRFDISQEIFSLGIFTAGLASFVQPDETNADESAMAGMELSLLGTQIRPFVFFNGQGELMGHVWSGTASERTTAFQALAMLQDHLQYLRLGPGFIAELDLKGGTSIDLSGQVQISLWNRNADSVIEKSAGILIVGLMKIDSSFVRSQVEFSMAVEPKLRFETYVDFYSGVAVCIKVNQPETVVRNNIYKIERIPGSKHRLRKSKTKKYPVMGRTYLLNKKNTEMCNAISSR